MNKIKLFQDTPEGGETIDSNIVKIKPSSPRDDEENDLVEIKD